MWPTDRVSAQADFGRPLAVAAPWASLTVSGIDVQHLSLFSLQFRDTSLEHAFTTATVSASFLGIDRTICFHKLWISALLLVPILTGHINSTPLGKALWMGYICVLLAHSMLMHLASKVYRDKRQLIVIPLKLLLVVILTAFVPTFVLKEVLSTASYVEVLLLGAGLVMQLCTGVCIPMFWRHHLPLALCTVSLYNYVMLRPLTDVFMCSQAAITNTGALYSMLDDTVYTVGGLLMPCPMQRPVAASPRAQVYILVLWLQLLFGLLVPAFYLYCTEFRSRAAFLQQRQQQPQHTLSASTTSTSAPVVARTSRGIVSRSCSSAQALVEHLPSQPVVLGAAFLLLLAIMAWNVLHLCMGWLMPVLERSGAYGFTAHVAGQHGLAASCFASPVA